MSCAKCARLVERLRNEQEMTQFYKKRDVQSRLLIDEMQRESDESTLRIEALTKSRDAALVELRAAQDAAKLAINEYDQATRDLEREYQEKAESAAKEAKQLRAHLKYIVGCINGVADKVKYEASMRGDDE